MQLKASANQTRLARVIACIKHGVIVQALLVMLFGLMVSLTGAAVAQDAPEGGTLNIPGFNHIFTGFPLENGHKEASCESCHINGQLAETPNTCIGCHNNELTRGKSAGHPPASNECAQCHTETNWVAIAFDHSFVAGDCASCHNGRRATGKSAQHIPSTNSCEDCHLTNRWSNVRFDHGAVSGICATCHNGSVATGKTVTHIPSTNTCDDCHVTTSWSNVRFDHASVTGACATCHNGSVATGKSANHIQSSNTCDACHVTANWSSVRFDHNEVTGSCSTCHNGSTATGKPNGHFVTTGQCDDCHRTSSWSQVRYSHSSGLFPAGHSSNNCTDCHRTNSATAPWIAPGFAPDCAGCHARDYEQGPHKKYENPNTVFYRVDELRDCTGSCHMYTDSSQTNIKKRRNSEHRPTDGEF